MKVIIGTRGSKLALIQTQMVMHQLQSAYPEDSFSYRIVKTTGDVDAHTPLHQMKDKGIFVKEIEQLLIDGEIDMAVHSMKDMPSDLPEGLCFADAWQGEDPRDVYISRTNIPLEHVAKGARIATGSRRRVALLHKSYPDIQIVGIRGNIDTRLATMEKEGYDGIILAAAGIKRLQRSEEITNYLDPTCFIPACTQGVLALEVASSNQELLEKLNRLRDPATMIRVQAERAFLKGVDGGCHIAVGAYLEVKETNCTLYAVLGDETSEILVSGQMSGSHQEAEQLGAALASELLRKRDTIHG